MNKDQDYLASSCCLGSKKACRKRELELSLMEDTPVTVRVSQILFRMPVTLAMIEKSSIAFLHAIFNVISTIYKDSYFSTYTKCYVRDEQRLNVF